MKEIERTREREREPIPDRTDGAGWYANRRYEKVRRDRAAMGKLVIHGDERAWEICPTGRLYRFLGEGIEDTALMNWSVFKSDIKTNSQSHRHQGGIVIYVVEGRGWSMVNGVRCPWKAGDLLLLPITPGGVEHQHFNGQPGMPVRWVAFFHHPLYDSLGGAGTTVSQDSPIWLATGTTSVVGTAQDGADGPAFRIGPPSSDGR
jgi:hypothetical protein